MHTLRLLQVQDEKVTYARVSTVVPSLLPAAHEMRRVDKVSMNRATDCLHMNVWVWL